MNAEIVSIGTELLLGEIDDTNATYLARQLKMTGLNLYFRTTVGDNEERIADALRLASTRADIVITTGGLGPTIDDMTRQSVAAAVGQPLVFRPDLMEQIAARFAKFGTRMTDNNRTQAMLPEKAIAIENPVGTAPGFIVETGHGAIISLPGVPHEMKHLVEQTVIPFLRERGWIQGVIKLRVLRTAGAGESWLGEQVADLMQLSNPTVGTAAHGGQTDIRITVKAEDEAAADRMLADMEAQIRARIGEYIFGVDKESVEAALIAALVKNGQRLILCEAGTGGVLGQRLGKQSSAPDALAAQVNYETSDAMRTALGLDTHTLEISAHDLIHALDTKNETGHPAVIAAIVIEPESTLIAVSSGGQIRERRYNYGENARNSIPWLGGWAIGTAWRLITEQNQRPDSDSAISPALS